MPAQHHASSAPERRNADAGSTGTSAVGADTRAMARTTLNSEISNDNHMIRPLLAMANMRRYKAPVLGFVAGSVFACFAMLNGNDFYQSESRFYVDARQAQTTAPDLKAVINPEFEARLLNEKLMELTSKPVLEKVVHNLGLEKTKLFNDNQDQNFLADFANWYRSLFHRAPVTPMTALPAETVEQVEQAIKAEVESTKPVISVKVTTSSPRISALIANQLVDVLKENNNLKQPVRTVSPSDLDTMLAKVQSADQAVADYESQIRVDPQPSEEKELAAELTDIRAHIVATQKNLDVLKKSGGSPTSLASLSQEFLGAKLAALNDQRRDAQMKADQLALNLGPKHPDLQAAQKVVASLTADMNKEIPQLVKALEADLSKKKSAEALLVKQLDERRAESPEMITLPPTGPSLLELQQAADAAHAQYSKMLAEGAQQKTPDPMIRMIAKAVIPHTPMHPDLLAMILAILAGGFIGIGLVSIATFAMSGTKEDDFSTAPVVQMPQPRFEQTLPITPEYDLFEPAAVRVPEPVKDAVPQAPDLEEIERLNTRLQRLALLLDQADSFAIAANDDDTDMVAVFTGAEKASYQAAQDLYDRVYSRVANTSVTSQTNHAYHASSQQPDIIQVRNELRALRGRVRQFAEKRG